MDEKKSLKETLKQNKAAERAVEWLYRQYIGLKLRYGKVQPNKVVFGNFCGKGYGDNPKYIAEEILRQGLEWDLVWLTGKDPGSVPDRIRCVPYGSQEAMLELSSAKIRVDNVRNSLCPPKKRGQIWLQTWHGGVSFKQVEKAAASTLSKEYLDAAMADGRDTDAIVCACRIQKEDFEENFWLNPKTEILRCGLPRNDILFRGEWVAEKYRQIRAHFGIRQDTKIVLYMPTFRDDGSLDGYRLDFDGILREMEQRFHEDVVILIRLHPNVGDQAGFIGYNDKILNGTSWPDAQELYMAADYMISDYSSSFLDFALLNRPVFLCLLDYEKYRRERGLNEVFEQCPFPRAYTNEQLLENIRNFSEEKYWESMAAFRETWQPYDDGHAAGTIVDWMKNKMQEG